MFGDKFILGAKEIVVNKNRILLPVKMTGCEPGEELYLFYSNNRDCLRILPIDPIDELGKMYKNFDFNKREEKFLELSDFFHNCIGKIKVDEEGRVFLGKAPCSEVGIDNDAYIVGCFDELRVYPSEEAYIESVKNNQSIQKKIGSI